jgi:hypothetical protein
VTGDLGIFLAFMACFLIALAVGGALADWLDPFDERDDARSRNQARRVR